MNTRKCAATPWVAATIGVAALAAATPAVAWEADAVPATVSLPSGSRPIRFLVVDPQTRQPIPGAYVLVEEPVTSVAAHAACALRTGFPVAAPTPAFDTTRWAPQMSFAPAGDKLGLVVIVPVGTTVILRQQATPAAKPAAQSPPVQDIYIKVTASRTQVRTTQTNAGTQRTNKEINTFVNRAANDTRALTQGQSGVASDSNGQQHIRGEHADISFVVDGVPLPDTLSGRQGSVVAASSIESLEILTGGYAPEFGGQTAAVLNVATRPGVTKNTADLTFQGGGYNTINSDFSAAGPLGARGSYVLNVNTNRTDNAVEPQQPDEQTAHNAGTNESYFAKFRLAPSSRDSLSLTLSRAPGRLELSNRTGLSSRFASAGQGYGFLGQRNADGTRPDATADNANALGAQTLLLPSQQAEGQAIVQHEVNEFATLTWRRQTTPKDALQFAGVLLHSAQDLNNSDPAIDLNSLPVDNSIEYSPSATRSVYHYQINGDYTARRGQHRLKVGFLNDSQKGDESYQLIPGSQLAQDALAALAPDLAPAGTTQSDAQGNPLTDINGNPVYTAQPGATAPTLRVHRSGFYRAAYLQDTWEASHHLTANYGLRYDRYRQGQNLGQPVVDSNLLSPRLNMSYAYSRGGAFRWSFNRLFNVPPLAQGAVIGEPIKPETLDQYDVSVEQQVVPGQTTKLAYYYKQIHNQVDTGLLIPGSQIGLYSAINLQYGGVHGIEASYEFSPLGGHGLDGYVNYTYAIARPNGVDNTGAQVPAYNDHDQRHTVGVGLAYLWKGGASTALTFNYGSGLASSPVPPSLERIARSQVDLRLSSGPHVLGGRGGIGLDVTNLFDDRKVINFQSAFSGTRFQQGRRILFTVNGSF